MNERDILQATTDHVRGLLSGEGSGHDWFHVERVRNTALRIAREERADIRACKRGHATDARDEEKLVPQHAPDVG